MKMRAGSATGPAGIAPKRGLSATASRQCRIFFTKFQAVMPSKKLGAGIYSCHSIPKPALWRSILMLQLRQLVRNPNQKPQKHGQPTPPVPKMPIDFRNLRFPTKPSNIISPPEAVDAVCCACISRSVGKGCDDAGRPWSRRKMAHGPVADLVISPLRPRTRPGAFLYQRRE